jgi:hypothetical protein
LDANKQIARYIALSPAWNPMQVFSWKEVVSHVQRAPAISLEAARSAFEDLAVKLFFKLEAECQVNAVFALPAWIAPTFAAAQQAFAVWNQAVDAIPTATPEKGPSNELPPYLV